MSPLNVALVIRDKPALRKRAGRSIGLFSYPVHEFEWQHVSPGEGFILNKAELKEYDAIILEDGSFGAFRGKGPPVIGVFWDTTWTDRHYHRRLAQSMACDLALIDHDDLARFKAKDRPVRRLSYCVNDLMFRPYSEGKTVDVCHHANTKRSPVRQALNLHLTKWAAEAGRTLRVGVVPVVADYARAMSAARMVVNWPQSPGNRPHRVFEAMACGSCLVSGALPIISNEVRLVEGVHYHEALRPEKIGKTLTPLLAGNRWQRTAESGRQLVTGNHTWRVRAGELRQMLATELGL